MGFYNMSQGDAPVFKFIADHYAISDNFHQGIMGGTGASFIYLGTGDLAFYGDGNGNPLTPPEKLIDCLPFSFNFRLMSTVPAFTLRASSAFSGLMVSK